MESKQIETIISDETNSLSVDDVALLSQLYNEVSADIRSAVKNKSGESLDFDFWIDILSIGMTCVEHLSASGSTKSDLVVQVVAIVLENELKVGDEQKKRIVAMFKSIAPGAIRVLCTLSKKINIEAITTKCCPCF